MIKRHFRFISLLVIALVASYMLPVQASAFSLSGSTASEPSMPDPINNLCSLLVPAEGDEGYALDVNDQSIAVGISWAPSLGALWNVNTGGKYIVKNEEGGEYAIQVVAVSEYFVAGWMQTSQGDIVGFAQQVTSGGSLFGDRYIVNPVSGGSAIPADINDYGEAIVQEDADLYHVNVPVGNGIYLNPMLPTSVHVVGNDMNNSNQVVGSYYDGNNSYGFRLDVTTGDYISIQGAWISAINENGDIVYTVGTEGYIRYDDGTVVSLGTNVNPSALNDDGTVVGTYNLYGASRPFVWRGTYVQDLGDFCDLEGTTLMFAYEINNLGQIVGSALWTQSRDGLANEQYLRGFVINLPPETRITK